MIHFLVDEPWDPRWELGRFGEIIVDLRDANDQEEIVRRLGAVMRPGDAIGDTRHGDLNQLLEIMIYWMEERWGVGTTVYVRGAGSIEKCGPQLLAEITHVFWSALWNSAGSRADDGAVGSFEQAREAFCVFFSYS